MNTCIRNVMQCNVQFSFNICIFEWRCSIHNLLQHILQTCWSLLLLPLQCRKVLYWEAYIDINKPLDIILIHTKQTNFTWVSTYRCIEEFSIRTNATMLKCDSMCRYIHIFNTWFWLIKFRKMGHTNRRT